MTIPEAISNFALIAGDVFPIEKGHWFSRKLKIALGVEVYDSEVLEKKIKDLLMSRGQDPDLSLMEAQNAACRV